mmetsp:Transcript_25243/g.54561  ORF Transcript_25243/g.54561 Transcript_25243/m.54561 type:complete len:109 (-) Transcript_25243:160-486(-)
MGCAGGKERAPPAGPPPSASTNLSDPALQSRCTMDGQAAAARAEESGPRLVLPRLAGGVDLASTPHRLKLAGLSAEPASDEHHDEEWVQDVWPSPRSSNAHATPGSRA